MGVQNIVFVIIYHKKIPFNMHFVIKVEYIWIKKRFKASIYFRGKTGKLYLFTETRQR